MQCFEHPIDVGRRVVIHGATGSGKTTLSRRLGELLGVPAIELDALRHARGWDSIGWDDMRATLQRRLEASPAGWVCEGNYSPVRDVYMRDVDSVIWLKLPWRVSFPRLFCRTVSRAWTREPLYHEGGPRESWRLTFGSRSSILLWSITNHRHHVASTRERLAEVPNQDRVFVLRSPREVDAFLVAVAAGLHSEAESPARRSV